MASTPDPKTKISDETKAAMSSNHKELKRKLPADFDDPIPKHSDVPAYRELWSIPLKQLELEIEKLSKQINGPVDPNVHEEMVRVLLIRKSKEEAAANNCDLETAAMRGAKSDIQDSEGEDAEEEDKTLSKALSGSDEQKEPEKKEEDEDLLCALAALEVACQNIIKYERDISVTGSE